MDSTKSSLTTQLASLRVKIPATDAAVDVDDLTQFMDDMMVNNSPAEPEVFDWNTWDPREELRRERREERRQKRMKKPYSRTKKVLRLR